MGRTNTVGERNTIKASTVNHYFWVEVENADRTWKDLTNLQGIDWVDGGEIKDSIDQTCATFSLRIRRADTAPDGSEYIMSPTWGASPLNRNDAMVYAPLLDAGRGIKIYAAAVALGAAPLVGDKKLLLHGRIDKVQWDSDPIIVTGRDLGGWLINTQIQEKRSYGVTAPTLFETIMQSILTEWPSGIVSPVTLNVPASPGAVFNNASNPPKQQETKSVLEALQQDWAQLIGWVCRYKWDEASGTFKLTFYDIDRSTMTPIDTFGPTEYKNITNLDISDEFVRNSITGSCYGPDGNLIKVTKDNLPSQAKYGVKWAGIQLAAGDAIDNESSLTTLVNAAVSDLGAPFAEQTMETLLYWPVELGDVYTFKANSDHYDSDQVLAVVAFSHAWTKGEGVTTMDCRGNVVGAYHSWFRVGLGETGTPSDLATGLNKYAATDSADMTTKTFTMVCGASVDRVNVYLNQMLAPPATDPWPSDGVAPGVAPLIPDPVTRIVSYTVTKPSAAYQKYILFEAMLSDLSAATGPFSRRKSVVDPPPNALTATLHGVRTGALADISADVKAGSADWPVTVDFFADSPFSAAIATTSISANVVLDKNSAGLTALGGLSLPQREVRRFFVRLTNVAGEIFWGDPLAIDRDPLPLCFVTINDYRPAPTLKVNYDSDTDEVKFFLPGGRTKTFTGLTGAGVVSYTVGDAPDSGSVESAMSNDETRTGYQIDIKGGGQYLTMWGGSLTGALHGETTGPSLTVTVTPFATTADIAYSGTGTITLSIDGGAYATPAASPLIGIARAATVDHTYSFKCVQAGQTIVDTVVIPSLLSDAMSPDLTVTPGTPTNTTQPFTVTSSNPRGSGAVPVITVTPYNCSMIIGGITYTTPVTIASGTVVTANRPTTVTDTQAHLVISSAIAGGGTETIDVEVLSQLNFGPTLDLRATPGGTPTADFTITYSGSGTITYSVDGASYVSPPATGFTVARHATLDHTLSFKAVADGQTIVDSVTIPSLQSDAITPDLVVIAGTPTASTQPYTATFTNPRTGGAAVAGTVQLYGPVASFNINGGTNFNEGDGAKSFSSGDVITINRPVSTTTTQAHIRFRAAISGAGSEEVKIPILASLNVGPTLVLTTTPGSSSYSIALTSGIGTITYSVDGGGYATPTFPVVYTRDSTSHALTFKAIADGQTITQQVDIPALPASGQAALSLVSTSGRFYPGDGGGSFVIHWVATDIPAGATFDISVVVTAGSTGGSGSKTQTGISNGDTIDMGSAGGLGLAVPSCNIVITAKLNGVAIASGTVTGPLGA